MNQPPYGPPQHPPGHYYGPYGPPPKKRMGAGAIVAIVFGSIVGVLVLIGIIESALGTDTKGAPQAAPSSTTAPKTKTPARKTDPPATKPAGYADGDYIIGEDIPPGTYQTVGAQAGAFEFCMVSTKPTADGVFPQLKSANKDERIIITIAAKDGILSISGCEPLTRRK